MEFTDEEKLGVSYFGGIVLASGFASVVFALLPWEVPRALSIVFFACAVFSALMVSFVWALGRILK